MPSEEAGSDRRLHPVSLLFQLGSIARRILLPAILVLFVSGGRGLEVWLGLLFLPAGATAILSYWFYRYRLSEGELVIREGVLSRKERNIPYSRVQNVARPPTPRATIGVYQGAARPTDARHEPVPAFPPRTAAGPFSPARLNPAKPSGRSEPPMPIAARTPADTLRSVLFPLPL